VPSALCTARRRCSAPLAHAPTDWPSSRLWPPRCRVAPCRCHDRARRSRWRGRGGAPPRVGLTRRMPCKRRRAARYRRRECCPAVMCAVARRGSCGGGVIPPPPDVSRRRGWGRALGRRPPARGCAGGTGGWECDGEGASPLPRHSRAPHMAFSTLPWFVPAGGRGAWGCAQDDLRLGRVRRRAWRGPLTPLAGKPHAWPRWAASGHANAWLGWGEGRRG